MALRDAGHRVTNLAYGLGSRVEDRELRRAELEEACRRAGFTLAVLEGSLTDRVRHSGASLVVSPAPSDVHPTHAEVATEIAAALQEMERPPVWWQWSLWGPLARPTLYVPFDEARLEEILVALAAHESQLARIPYDRLVRARAELGALLGAELVFGFGAGARSARYAELLLELEAADGGWQRGRPREIDPARPWP